MPIINNLSIYNIWNHRDSIYIPIKNVRLDKYPQLIYEGTNCVLFEDIVKEYSGLDVYNVKLFTSNENIEYLSFSIKGKVDFSCFTELFDMNDLSVWVDYDFVHDTECLEFGIKLKG